MYFLEVSISGCKMFSYLVYQGRRIQVFNIYITRKCSSDGTSTNNVWPFVLGGSLLLSSQHTFLRHINGLRHVGHTETLGVIRNLERGIKVDSIKKHNFIYFIAIAIILIELDVGILIPSLGIGRTSIDAISSRFDNGTNIWRLKRIVSEINLNNKRLVFYESYNGNIMVSILKKKWNGMWKVVDTSGEMISNSRNNVVSTMGGNFDRVWVSCGIIYNDKVERVRLNGKDTNILDEGFIRIWYSIEEEPVNKYEVEALDYNGERLN